MNDVKLLSYWSAVQEGLEWRKNDYAHKVDQRGVGSLLIPIRFAVGGNYLITSKTRSSHGTEWNEVWVRFGDDDSELGCF